MLSLGRCPLSIDELETVLSFTDQNENFTRLYFAEVKLSEETRCSLTEKQSSHHSSFQVSFFETGSDPYFPLVHYINQQIGILQLPEGPLSVDTLEAVLTLIDQNKNFILLIFNSVTIDDEAAKYLSEKQSVHNALFCLIFSNTHSDHLEPLKHYLEPQLEALQIY